jgi:hypothetical protein
MKKYCDSDHRVNFTAKTPLNLQAGERRKLRGAMVDAAEIHAYRRYVQHAET